MEVTVTISHHTTMNVIDIPDDDGDDDDVSVVYITPKTSSKGKKGISITDAISVDDDYNIVGSISRRSAKAISVENNELIVSNFCSKPSISGTKRVFIDLCKETPDDEIQILGSNLSLFSKNFTCDICVDEKTIRNKFKIMGCNHSYCKQCIQKYVSTRLQENISQISCPVSGCNGILEPYYCRSILPDEVFNRWGDALCEEMLMGFEKFYCPFRDCSAVLIDECRGENVVITESECPECRRMFCAKCKVAWHSGIVCEEFQKLHKDERGREDIQLMQLAKNQEWQRCPKCRIYVARTQGCAQMKCRCGCTFCYKCGAKSANHYCRSCGT